MITLYNTDDSILLQVEVEDRSYRIREIMGEHALYLYFSLPYFIELEPGSYVDFSGERYILTKPDNFKKNHTRDFNYTIKLEPYSAILHDTKIKFFVGANNTNFELTFPLTFQPRGFIQLLVDNLNLNDSGWIVGDCVVALEQLISFSNEFCDAALSKIAEAFNTEFEIVGKTIHLHKVERTDPPLPLAYGRNMGFKPGVGRINMDDNKVINRLYIISSDRNIDPTTYRANTLRMPANSQTTLNGITYVTDEYGVFVEQLNTSGRRVEDSADLSYIYPSRIGTVSQVEGVYPPVIPPAYPLVTGSVTRLLVTEGVYAVEDDSIIIDYSLYIAAGTTMRIAFLDGYLSGFEFDVQYIHADRRFVLSPTEYDGEICPSWDRFPDVGDKYMVSNVQLPPPPPPPPDPNDRIWYFYDASIPSDLDYSQYMVGGLPMTVVFQDGNLAGLEFKAEYVHANRQFKIIPKEVNGLIYPLDPDIPVVGNTYVVFNVTSPQAYIDVAEMDLFHEAVILLQAAENPRYSFTGTLDEVFAVKNWEAISSRINIGNLVSFSDSQFLTTPINIRIRSIKDFVNKPKSPVIELSDNVTSKTFSETISSLRSNIISNTAQVLQPTKIYTYVQNTPTSFWFINHNLNKYPSVSVIDSAGTLVEGQVLYTGLNSLIITFTAAFSGKAALN